MKDRWPTLEGRLNQPLTSRGEALRQMKANGDILTPWAEKELQKFEKKQKLMRGVTGNTPDFESGDDIVNVGSTPTASATFNG